VKITDFGVSLARNQVNMTATGMVMGTAQYLSPEQAVGKPATPLSDLYSLGIIAYEALVGHRPFTGPTAVDIAVAHVNNPVPPLPPSVDKQLAALVTRLLSKEPSARPASGEELAQLLDRLVPRTPPSGVPVLVATQGRTPDTFATAVASAPAASSAPPPSYPPRRTRRAEEPTTRSAVRKSPPTTGTRLGRSGRLTWPLLALVLLLVGLLGAALAAQLTKADGPPGGQPRLTATASHYSRGDTLDGMITENGSAALAADPASTEAKDA